MDDEYSMTVRRSDHRTERLFMDDSHRDDCFILAENKGLILFEES